MFLLRGVNAKVFYLLVCIQYCTTKSPFAFSLWFSLVKLSTY